MPHTGRGRVHVGGAQRARQGLGGRQTAGDIDHGKQLGLPGQAEEAGPKHFGGGTRPAEEHLGAAQERGGTAVNIFEFFARATKCQKNAGKTLNNTKNPRNLAAKFFG